MATYRADKLNRDHDGKTVRFSSDGVEHHGVLAFEHFDQDEDHWRINYIDDAGERRTPLVGIGTLVDVEE